MRNRNEYTIVVAGNGQLHLYWTDEDRISYLLHITWAPIRQLITELSGRPVTIAGV